MFTDIGAADVKGHPLFGVFHGHAIAFNEDIDTFVVVIDSGQLVKGAAYTEQGIFEAIGQQEAIPFVSGGVHELTRSSPTSAAVATMPQAMADTRRCFFSCFIVGHR